MPQRAAVVGAPWPALQALQQVAARAAAQPQAQAVAWGHTLWLLLLVVEISLARGAWACVGMRGRARVFQA